MNLDELINQATTIVEEDYDYETWNTLIKNILADLNPVAKVLSTVLIGVEIDDDVDTVVPVDTISENLYEIVSVSFKPTGQRSKLLKKISSQNTALIGWYRKQDEVALRNIPFDDGQIEVDYYEILTISDDEPAEFNLPEKYHEVLLKGVMAIAMQKEEELDRKHDFLGEYLMMKRQMQAERVMEVEPWYAPLVAPSMIGGN